MPKVSGALGSANGLNQKTNVKVSTSEAETMSINGTLVNAA